MGGAIGEDCHQEGVSPIDLHEVGKTTTAMLHWRVTRSVPLTRTLWPGEPLKASAAQSVMVRPSLTSCRPSRWYVSPRPYSRASRGMAVHSSMYWRQKPNVPSQVLNRAAGAAPDVVPCG